MAEPSIAMIPSGYKAEKIYSVLPTNGNADLDFSRNSKATRINEQGLIEEMAVNVPILDYSDGTCPSLKLQPQSRNLITYSESFGNSYWTKSGASIQGDASTAGVEKVVNGDFASSSSWDIDPGWVISGGVATHNGSAGAVYQVNPNITNGKMYMVTLSVTNVSAGVLYPHIAGVNSFVEISSNGNYSFCVVAGSGYRSIDMYCNALFNGSIDNVSIKEVQGFSAPSVDSPLGAFKLVEDTSTGEHYLKVGLGSSLNAVVSFCVKKIDREYIQFKGVGNVQDYINFNLINGTIGSVGSNVTNYGITPLSDGWYRCWALMPLTNAITIKTILNSNDNWSSSYTGDGTSGVYIFGAQLEEQAYATSYIKTEGSTQTRLQDSASKSGLENEINSEEGVLYAEISALNEDQPVKAISISNQSLSNRVLIVLVGGELRGQFVSGTDNISKTTSGVVIENFNKIACSYTSTTFKVFVNGLQIGNTSAISTALVGLTGLSFDRGDGGLKFVGKTKQLQVYKTALTDAQLTTLTTI